MIIVGWLVIALAAWLLDSAVRNRPPIETLKEIVVSGALPVTGKNYPAAPHPAATADPAATAPAAGSAAPTAYTTTATGSRAVVVQFALAQVGKRYVWGGDGPDVWDCSGLTKAAWAKVGIDIPRTSIMQGTLPNVPMNQLLPGDLVTYYNPISHVAMFIGNGQVVSAMSPELGIGVRPLTYAAFASGHRPRGA